MVSKQQIRDWIWSEMEKRGIARFPMPIRGRVPNFENAELAAKKLLELPEFQKAKILKINPDSPQRPVRQLALELGKLLYCSSPRLRKGFVEVRPEGCRGREKYASTIRGFFRFGKLVKLEDMKPIDLFVTGSVAVDRRGFRCGKGTGYADLGYAIMSQAGLCEPSTPIATTVHPIQIVDHVPETANDIPVDFIITAEKIIKTSHPPRKKMFVMPEILTPELRELPILRELGVL
jgi:5-formyltetrahydrofolate cyclo-ligase